MSYYQDFTRYTYERHFWRPHTLNVGWLNPTHEFKRARPSAEFLDKLWAFSRYPVARFRGCQECRFCWKKVATRYVGPWHAKYRHRCLSLGDAEIRVFGRDGQIFAAPTLLFHYVVDHHYQPPPEFMDAVLHGPCPPGFDYFSLLGALGLRWSKESFEKMSAKPKFLLEEPLPIYPLPTRANRRQTHACHQTLYR